MRKGLPKLPELVRFKLNQSLKQVVLLEKNVAKGHLLQLDPKGSAQDLLVHLGFEKQLLHICSTLVQQEETLRCKGEGVARLGEKMMMTDLKSAREVLEGAKSCKGLPK